MNKRIIIIGVLAVLGAGALTYRNFHKQPDNLIRISGNIELTQVNVAFKVSGRLIERAVDEGDTVKKGMVIARLDREQLLRQRDSAEAALAQAQSQLSQASTTAEWAKESQSSDLAQRRAEKRVGQERVGVHRQYLVAALDCQIELVEIVGNDDLHGLKKW